MLNYHRFLQSILINGTIKKCEEEIWLADQFARENLCEICQK